MATTHTRPSSAPSPSTPEPKGASRGLVGSGGGGRAAGEVWSCGHRLLPMFVQNSEGKSFRPEFVAWLCPSGVLAASPAHPDELERALLGLLRQARTKPLVGKPRSPTAVRVSDPKLAPVIAKALGPAVKVRVAATPELDALAEHFVNHLNQEEDSSDPWVDDGLDPDDVGGFFAAAASLYRAAPWKAIGDAAVLIAVDSAALSLRNGCLSVIGGEGSDVGFLLFDSVADYEAMRRTAAEHACNHDHDHDHHGHDHDHGHDHHGHDHDHDHHDHDHDHDHDHEGPGVSVFSVGFEPRDQMPETTLDFVRQQGWPVADAKAYPLLLLVDPDGATRPPTGDDLMRAWAISEALARLTRDHGDRLAAEDGAPLRKTYVLENVPGRPEVTLTFPPPDDADPPQASAAKKGSSGDQAAKKAAKKAGGREEPAAKRGGGREKPATKRGGGREQSAAKKAAGREKPAAKKASAKPAAKRASATPAAKRASAKSAAKQTAQKASTKPVKKAAERPAAKKAGTRPAATKKASAKPGTKNVAAKAATQKAAAKPAAKKAAAKPAAKKAAAKPKAKSRSTR